MYWPKAFRWVVHSNLLTDASPSLPDPGQRRGYIYADCVPRPSLRPGTHGKLSVARSRPALRSHGEFVAHARVRPSDGSSVQLVRRFGDTEGKALAGLRAAIEERIGAVAEQPVPTEAGQQLLLARFTFAHFSNDYFHSTPFVLAGGDAEEDQRTSGSDHIPNRVVEGFAASVADHVRAWCRATAPTYDDPRPFVYVYADYTLWRAVLESIAAAIWIVGPETSRERIERATRVAIYEWKKSAPVPRFSGETDASATRLYEEQRAVIERVCDQVGFSFDSLAKKGAEPSKVVRAAREYLGREGDDFSYWWTICSRYAHAQSLTVMLRGVRTRVESPHGQVVDVTTDETLLAELVEFARNATEGLVELLVRRGLHRAPRMAETNSAGSR